MNSSIHKSFFLLFLMSLSMLNGYSQTTTCANASAFGWGSNLRGELGDGTKVNKSQPSFIGNASDWKQISAARENTLVLKTNGTIWTWTTGTNADSRLVQLGTSTDWKQVSNGGTHIMGIKTNGSLWGWGEGFWGELGDGSTDRKDSAISIGTSTNWKQVSAGNAYTTAIKTDGTLWAWGWNRSGELGDGTTNQKNVPTQIGTGTNWKQVVASPFLTPTTAALKTDGSLWIWGEGIITSTTSPKQVGSSTDWQQVTVGGSHIVALKTDGSLWSFGDNFYGQLGNGSGPTAIHVQIGNSKDWKQVIAGEFHTVAIKTDGSLWSWGANGAGNLGDGTLTTRYSPVRIGNTTGWSQVTISSGGFTIGIKCNDQTVAFDPAKCYRIVNKVTGKVLEIKNASQADGTQIYQGTFKETPIRTNQLWQIVKLSDGNYNIVSKNNGKLMDIDDNSAAGYCAEGTITQQFPADGSNSQKWRLDIQPDLSFKIINLTCNKALRVESGSTADGASVGIKNDFGAEYFKWFIEETPCSAPIDPLKCYRIVNKATFKALQVKESAQAEGAQIYQWSNDYSQSNQLWQITKLADGKYNLTSVSSGKLMSVSTICFEGEAIQQLAANGTNSQKWRLEIQSDLSFKIINDNCNKALRVDNISSADGATVGIKNDFGAESFKWMILESECIPSTCVTEGSILVERWFPPQLFRYTAPTTTTTQTNTAPVWNRGDRYNTRARGFIRPQTTGVYKFNVTGDNTAQLFLSTNTSANKAVRIAYTNNWTGSTDYTKYPTQTSNSITLIANQLYYFEVLHEQSAGGDFWQVSWQTPTNTTWQPITAPFLARACSSIFPLSATQETFGFEARAVEGRAKLQWITNTGYKNDYFEIERLNANGSFEVLNRQNTEGGTDLKSYSFTDNDPLDGDNFYRINSIANGNTPPQYSEVKKVSFSKNDGISIFPNPADDYINIDLRKYEGQTVALSFYNSVGLMVKKQTIEKASAAPQRVDMQGFGTGSYLVRVQSEGKREVTRLFNITK